MNAKTDLRQTCYWTARPAGTWTPGGSCSRGTRVRGCLPVDPRLRGRVDAADAVQEAFATTAGRAEFFGQSAQPLFLGLR